MVSEVALDVDQVKVDEPPDVTAVGEAESVTVGATWFTVTVAVTVAVPLGPVAVSVYVVVCAGVTEPCPFKAMLVTSSCGIAGLMVTDVALVEVHVSVLNWPAVIVVGEAVRVAAVVFGGGGGG